MIRHFPLMLALVVSAGVARADDYCSLVVDLVGSFQPAIPVKVSVEEPNGRLLSVKAASGGMIRFCDLGILPVTIRVVDSNECNPVTIQNVRLYFGASRRVTVAYDSAACSGEEPPLLSACVLLLRFFDDEGRTLPAVDISSPSFARGQVSDQLGRVRVSLNRGERTQVTAHKSAFDDKTVELDCKSGIASERIVTLRRQRQ